MITQRPPHPPETDDGAWPLLDTSAKVAALLASSGGRLLDLQLETSMIVLSDLSARCEEMLKAMAAGSGWPAWPHWSHGNAQRMADITRAWATAVAEAQATTFDLLGECLLASAGPAGSGVAAPAADTPGPGRRLQSVVINFPDRRRPAA